MEPGSGDGDDEQPAPAQISIFTDACLEREVPGTHINALEEFLRGEHLRCLQIAEIAVNAVRGERLELLRADDDEGFDPSVSINKVNILVILDPGKQPAA